jgi:hypothetical protein
LKAKVFVGWDGLRGGGGGLGVVVGDREEETRLRLAKAQMLGKI